MEPTDYYRPPVDMHGHVDHSVDFYNYPIGGMPSGADSETMALGWSNGTPAGDQLLYGASHWYGRDADGTSLVWNTAPPHNDYDVVSSPWTFNSYGNQQHVESVPYSPQLSTMNAWYTPIDPLPNTVPENSDGGYFTPEYSTDYPTAANSTSYGANFLPMFYVENDKPELADCQTVLDAMEYTVPTPPLSPYEAVQQIDQSTVLGPPVDPAPPGPEVPLVIEIKILPSDNEQAPQPSKRTVVRQAKAPRKAQLQTQWSCDKCNKCFMRQLGLIQHNIIKHAGDRPFLCGKCGKRFADAALLDKHTNRHQSLDKPYKCEQCPKQFYYRMDMIRHNYKHTGNSPHICSYCPKVFSRQDHLRRHEFIHQRENAGNGPDSASGVAGSR